MNLSSRRRTRPEDAAAQAASDAIKDQVRKQMSTSLSATLGQLKDFESTSTFKSYASSVAGAQTLQDYEERRGAEESLEDLRRAGLTEHEIGLYLRHGLGEVKSAAVAAAKKPRRVATDEALQLQLSAIKEKLQSKSSAKPTSWQLDLQDQDDPEQPGLGHSEASSASYRMVWKPPDEIMKPQSGERSSNPPSEDGAFVVPTKSGRGVGESSLLPKWERVERVQPAGVVTRKPPEQSPICTTKEEIAIGRISVKAIRELPRFSNYEPGEPSQTLYVKNLASNATHGDLMAVFTAACDDQLTAGPLDIRLMKKGRLRCQAFVTFPSLEGAVAAVDRVNGYILHTKPVIIQYGRQPADNTAASDAKDASESEVPG